jgi:hypothetical protein
MSRSKRGKSPSAVISAFYGGAATFFFQVAAQLYSRSWTHYFSENMVAPGIESGPMDL